MLAGLLAISAECFRLRSGMRVPRCRENEDGFRAYLEPVSDPAFDGVTWQVVKAAVPANLGLSSEISPASPFE
jgi:hypothetical protein